MMRGVFVAIDGPSINIEPDAWKSAHAKGFPAQAGRCVPDSPLTHEPALTCRAGAVSGPNPAH